MTNSDRHASPRAERIWVVGSPGSGKTTLTRQLGARLGVDSIHIDDLFWNPGWTMTPDAELMRRVDRATSGDRWVIDGNYRRVQQYFRHRADLFVWLNMPLHVCLRRLTFRCMRRVIRKEPCCNGNYESLRETFASRESILLWTWNTYADLEKDYAQDLVEYPMVRLRNERQVAQWLHGFAVGRTLP